MQVNRVHINSEITFGRSFTEKYAFWNHVDNCYIRIWWSEL